MSLGTNHISRADVTVFVPEVWGGKVNEFYREGLFLATFFTDRSDEVTDGGDLIHTPGTSAFLAADKVAETQVALQSPTEADEPLTIDTHKHTAFLMEDVERAALKGSYRLREKKAQDAAYSVALALELAISAKFSDFTEEGGAAGSPLTDVQIRTAIATLGDKIQGAYREEDVRFILARKTVYVDVMDNDRYVSMDFGQVGTAQAGKKVRYIQGIECMMTSNIPSNATDYTGALVHKDAINFATSPLMGAAVGPDGTPGVRLQAEYKLEWLGELVVADIRYGVSLNRDDAGVKLTSVK